ncbi:MAG: Crp/Fnr family transcriptional regulator [Bacteroidota bacterium]
MQLFEASKIRDIPKGTFILRKGEVCKFGCKVISGCLKSFAIDQSGKEHIIQFAPEGWIITDMESLFNQKPSNIFIQAIEKSQVHWIDGNINNAFDTASREDLLEQIGLLTRNIMAANKRTRMLLSATGEERYQDFIETYPTLAQRLPLKLIASFIGITPEYLSEIRRKFAGK